MQHPAHCEASAPSRSDAIVFELAAKRQYRRLITYVESQARSGLPSIRSRMAQVSALAALCRPRHAWAILRDLPETGTYLLERILLEARLFMAMKQSIRATAALEQALAVAPADPRVRALQRRCAALDPDAPFPTDDPIAAARECMCAGDDTQARALLEFARDSGWTDTVIDDLLWALSGDFDAAETEDPGATPRVHDAPPDLALDLDCEAPPELLLAEITDPRIRQTVSPRALRSVSEPSTSPRGELEDDAIVVYTERRHTNAGVA